MNLNSIGAFEALNSAAGLEAKKSAPETDFSQVFNAGIQALNDTQVKADTLAEQLATGEDVELHDVMIATQEADIALRLATQLRNQALEAYREIMRMPI
jgi:flagellar hook-basal body complex protein FliE